MNPAALLETVLLLSQKSLVYWEPVFRFLGLSKPPEIVLSGNSACILFGEQKNPKPKHVSSILFWNVNGFRARWKANFLPVRNVIQAKTPDVFVITELRCNYENL